MVEITPSAQEYLVSLLSSQDEVRDIRIFISDPGTPTAETCIAYCKSGEEQSTDEKIEYTGFGAWIDERSKPFLAEALVDYAKDKMGGQLTIKAPNAKVPKVSADSPIEDRINYILHSEVNPSLAAHGGMVSLIEVVDSTIAVLKFGGGCQGCGMVDMTLKDGVEVSLLAQVPELTAIRDVTDHSVTENAYL